MVTPHAERRTVRREGRVVRKVRPAEAHDQTLLEAALLGHAARRGLSPKVRSVALDRRSSTLVLEAVGTAFPARAGEPQLRALGRTLAALHALPLPSAVTLVEVPVKLGPYAEECTELAERLGARAWAKALRRALVPWARGLDAATQPREPVLCHGDLKRSNLRRSGGRVLLVDFEAARWAEPAWELANTALCLGLTAEEEDLLLESYAPPRARAPLAERFHAYRLLGLVFFPLDMLDRVRAAKAAGAPLRGRSALALTPLHAERARQALSALDGRALPPLTGLG